MHYVDDTPPRSRRCRDWQWRRVRDEDGLHPYRLRRGLHNKGLAAGRALHSRFCGHGVRLHGDSAEGTLKLVRHNGSGRALCPVPATIGKGGNCDKIHAPASPVAASRTIHRPSRRGRKKLYAKDARLTGFLKRKAPGCARFLNTTLQHYARKTHQEEIQPS